MKKLKISQFAKQEGLSYRSALRMYHLGLIEGEQLPTGSVYVYGWAHKAPENDDIVLSAATAAQLSLFLKAKDTRTMLNNRLADDALTEIITKLGL